MRRRQASKSCVFILLTMPDQNPTSARPGEDVMAWHGPGDGRSTTPKGCHFGRVPLYYSQLQGKYTVAQVSKMAKMADH